jgi:hypothetical protein
MKYTLDNLPERNLEPPEGKFPEPEECSECGNEFPDKHYHCFTHLESTEDLRDYAHEKVEEVRQLNVCLEKAHKREDDYAKSIKILIHNANVFLADSLGITKGTE